MIDWKKKILSSEDGKAFSLQILILSKRIFLLELAYCKIELQAWVIHNNILSCNFFFLAENSDVKRPELLHVACDFNKSF